MVGGSAGLGRIRFIVTSVLWLRCVLYRIRSMFHIYNIFQNITPENFDGKRDDDFSFCWNLLLLMSKWKFVIFPEFCFIKLCCLCLNFPIYMIHYSESFWPLKTKVVMPVDDDNANITYWICILICSFIFTVAEGSWHTGCHMAVWPGVSLAWSHGWSWELCGMLTTDLEITYSSLPVKYICLR